MDIDTLLLEAASTGNTDAVASFLSAGGTVNCRDVEGNTALALAAKYGHHETVLFLLTIGYCFKNPKNLLGDTPLFLAIRGSHDHIVLALLENGASVLDQNENGETPLHVATEIKDGAIVRLLLSYGGDPNIRNTKGLTPLHLAVQLKVVDIVQLLIIGGAAVNEETGDGRNKTPLDLCVIETGVEVKSIIMLLLSRGAYVTEDSISDCVDHDIRRMLMDIALVEK
ncbi:hypothetical protein RCL1_008263 [Eukaryota sp. TZLM3-RCL]